MNFTTNQSCEEEQNVQRDALIYLRILWRFDLEINDRPQS